MVAGRIQGLWQFYQANKIQSREGDFGICAAFRPITVYVIVRQLRPRARRITMANKDGRHHEEGRGLIGRLVRVTQSQELLLTLLLPTGGHPESEGCFPCASDPPELSPPLRASWKTDVRNA